MSSVTKPLLKWVGGKTQILEKVLSLFPQEIHNYHEPFLGGGSVLLGLLSYKKAGKINVSGRVIASDWNAHLIYLYQNVQQRPSDVVTELRKLVVAFADAGKKTEREKDKTDKTEREKDKTEREKYKTEEELYYYQIRSQFNALPDKNTPLASAMLLFLNKTCFRGVYREGPHGFNVPFGHYKNPSILDETHLLEVSELIQEVVFVHQSFTDSCKEVVSRDFVYMDPPYAPESQTSFVSYTSDGFTVQKHHALFALCYSMTEKKVPWLMSNADVPLVKDAFPSPPFQRTTLSCRRAIHAKKPDTKTNELLISS